ncbi:tail morphogenetic protein [Staphylococcus phage vB_SauM-V1SA19]|nr:tail morphogenetic protein [Staphylococcus phage vB_SauM-V1SA19]
MANFLRNLHPLLRRNKNNKDNQDPNYALITALNDEMNNIESDTIKSKLQASLKTATGDYLDKFGDWFGVYRRINENDDSYRKRIIKYLLLKRGTNNAIISAIKDYLDNENINVSVYEPFKNIFYTNKSKLNGEDYLMGYYYRFAVINVSVDGYFPLEIIDVINEFKPAGVKLYLTYDGATTIKGDGVVKWLKNLPKIETYTDLDRLLGYDETFYGHLNMSEATAEQSDKTRFRTNKSTLNSEDILSGSSNIGRRFINYAYITTYAYEPTSTSAVTHIASLNDKGKEAPLDYYLYTSLKNTNDINISMETAYGVSYLYNNFNVSEFISRYKPNIDITRDNAKKQISDFVGELTIDFFAKSLVSPDESLPIKLQIFDFRTNEWLTVSETELSFYEKNIGVNIGYIRDYLNDDLNLFTRLEVNIGKDEQKDISINYMDLHFYNYKKDVYTIKPFKALVENYIDLTKDTYIEGFKVASLLNGDIINKNGYQPIKYLRLHATYDSTKPIVSITGKNSNNEVQNNTPIDLYKNTTNRNLLQSYKGDSNIFKGVVSTKEFYISSWADTLYNSTYLSKVLEPQKVYTLSFEMEITDANMDLKTYSDNHGIYLYSSTKGIVANGVKSMQRKIGNKIDVSITFTAPTITDHRLVVYTGRYTADGTDSKTPIASNTVKVTNLQLKEGATRKDYTVAPEDVTNVIDKAIVFDNILTDIQTIGINTTTPLKNIELSYSYYGDNWTNLKTISNLSQGETITPNNLVDLYDLETIDYSSITPFSRVILKTIWNANLNNLTNKKGSISNMSNNYFNAVWQEVDMIYNTTLSSMSILTDSEGNVFDSSTGQVIKLAPKIYQGYTDVDRLLTSTTLYNENITLGSNRFIYDLRDMLLSSDTFTVDNKIKVIDTYTEVQ